MLGLKEHNVVAVRSHLRYNSAAVEKVMLYGGGCACWARQLVITGSGRLLVLQ